MTFTSAITGAITGRIEICLPGRRLLARLIRWSYRTLRMLPLGRGCQWRTVKGIRMQIDSTDPADRAFYAGSYAPYVADLLAIVVRPDDLCLDVGAQKGFFTLQMAKAVGVGGRIIAFEPDPRAMEILKTNVQRNGYKQVLLHSYAVGDCEGHCQLALSRQLGWSSRFPNDIATPTVESSIAVRTRCLDDVVKELGILPQTHRLSFIKIDAEGSEPLILQGAQETLRRFRPTLHIEVNKPSLCAGGFSTDSIETLLRSLDYRLYAIHFHRTGRLLRHRLSLVPVTSLQTELGDCEDVLAVGVRECLGATDVLRGECGG